MASEPHRPPHDHVHGANRGSRHHLESARSLTPGRLPLVHRPRIVILEERPAVGAKRGIQRAAVRNRFERFDKLGLIFVIQAAAASDALPPQHFAFPVGKHGFAEGPRFQRHHREALVIGRHD